MKRIIILVVLVGLAGIAGIVARSAATRSEIRELVAHNQGEAREEIREKYELAPGAEVELAGVNGWVKIETSDSQTAEIHIERIAAGEEALKRRQFKIEATANSLSIKGEKRNGGFFSRIFGSEGRENVTLKLPRQVSLNTKGVNGSVKVGALDGAVQVSGVNGRVEIASATGNASFKGINGNIVVALKKLDSDGITLSGINGNIELQLASDTNASLEAKAMNGRVTSDVPWASVDEPKHGYYLARIGNGGSAITAKGINGNIRLTRAVEAAPPAPAAAGN